MSLHSLEVLNVCTIYLLLRPSAPNLYLPPWDFDEAAPVSTSDYLLKPAVHLLHMEMGQQGSREQQPAKSILGLQQSAQEGAAGN